MLIAAFFLTLVVANSSGFVTVTTRYGKVRGQKIKGIDSFLGIPFAKPPVGDLRWKLPEEVESWNDILIASSSGSLCPQYVNTLTFLRKTHPELTGYQGNEDCLTLNIYRPSRPGGDSKLPVLVFFHGGSFQKGGALPFSGQFLADRDVIVVVPQYRLGILGFATTSGGDITPNLGLHDQVQALKFVQKTISDFGGDPGKVTIGGQSAGGIAVGLHLVSPVSNGLFHQAICESGDELNGFAFAVPQQRPYLLLTGVAAKLGCPTNDSAKMVECLQNKEASALVTTRPDNFLGMPPLGWTPVVESGTGFLPDKPLNLRLQGKFSKVPLLAGIMAQDGGFFVGNVAPEAFLGGLSKTLYETILRRALAVMFPAVQSADRKEALYQALRFHYSDWPNFSDELENRNRILQLTTDALFGTTQDLQSKLHSRFAPTYFYVFGYTSTNPGTLMPEWLGATHSEDIPYMFGYPYLKKNRRIRAENDIKDDRNWTGKDRRVSDFFITLITNFMKSGNPTPNPVRAPNKGGLITWPAFTNQGLDYLSIDSKSSVQSKYRQNSYALWTNYLPWISTH